MIGRRTPQALDDPDQTGLGRLGMNMPLVTFYKVVAEAMAENPKKCQRNVSGVDAPDKKDTQRSDKGLK